MIKSAIQRYLIAGLLIVVAANAGYSVYLSHKRDQALADVKTAQGETEKERVKTQDAKAETAAVNRALAQTRQELEAARASLSLHADMIDTINQEKEAADARLQNALRGNRNWSDAPVPDSVREALR